MEAFVRAVGLGLLATLQGCSWLGDKAAEAVYPNLEQPSNREAPPTFKQFPSSAITQAVLGARGSGLNCSIPSLGKVFFSGANANTADVSLHFRPSCIMHDLCYRHGLATYGYAQADCDRALQASAYRMCRQINKEGEGNVYENCQVQAKKVLLGVSLGGAGSFQAAGASTYFEFDPMPEKADDYVVARAYPLTLQQAQAGALGIVTYHFFRNSVTARVLQVDPSDARQLQAGNASGAVTYPEQFIATPPAIEQLQAGQQAMLALARKGYANTNVNPVQFLAQVTGSKTSLRLDPCPAPLSIDCPVDTRGAINRLARVQGRPVLVSLLHDGLLRQEFLDEKRPPRFYRLNGSAGVNDGYRFLQNDLLLERDREANDTHAWVLVRGFKLNAEGRAIVNNPNAEGYAEKVLVIRQALGGDRNVPPQLFMIDAKETDDPLSLVRLPAGEGMALVTLSRTETSQPAPVALTLWQLPEGSDTLLQRGGQPLPDVLDSTFLDRPPMVVDAPGVTGPVFVWTRMRNEHSPDGPLAFDIRLTALEARTNAPMRELGVFKCILNLGDQSDENAASALATQAKHTKSVRSREDHTEETRRILREELRSRWKMGQTLVSQRPAEHGSLDDLSVTAIFKGYPGMSFQVALAQQDGRYRLKGTLPTPDWLACE